jgi:hypothetical protein
MIKTIEGIVPGLGSFLNQMKMIAQSKTLEAYSEAISTQAFLGKESERKDMWAGTLWAFGLVEETENSLPYVITFYEEPRLAVIALLAKDKLIDLELFFNAIENEQVKSPTMGFLAAFSNVCHKAEELKYLMPEGSEYAELLNGKRSLQCLTRKAIEGRGFVPCDLMMDLTRLVPDIASIEPLQWTKVYRPGSFHHGLLGFFSIARFVKVKSGFDELDKMTERYYHDIMAMTGERTWNDVVKLSLRYQAKLLKKVVKIQNNPFEGLLRNVLKPRTIETNVHLFTADFVFGVIAEARKEVDLHALANFDFGTLELKLQDPNEHANAKITFTPHVIAEIAEIGYLISISNAGLALEFIEKYQGNHKLSDLEKFAGEFLMNHSLTQNKETEMSLALTTQVTHMEGLFENAPTRNSHVDQNGTLLQNITIRNLVQQLENVLIGNAIRGPYLDALQLLPGFTYGLKDIDDVTRAHFETMHLLVPAVNSNAVCQVNFSEFLPILLLVKYGLAEEWILRTDETGATQYRYDDLVQKAKEFLRHKVECENFSVSFYLEAEVKQETTLNDEVVIYQKIADMIGRANKLIFSNTADFKAIGISQSDNKMHVTFRLKKLDEYFLKFQEEIGLLIEGKFEVTSVAPDGNALLVGADIVFGNDSNKLLMSMYYALGAAASQCTASSKINGLEDKVAMLKNLLVMLNSEENNQTVAKEIFEKYCIHDDEKTPANLRDAIVNYLVFVGL